MAHRILVDADLRSWHVFDVKPYSRTRAAGGAVPDRREGSDRRQEPHAQSALDRRAGERRAMLPGDLADGWLCFETQGEKRRLAPVPPAWAIMRDDALLVLLAQAEPVPQRLIELAAARARGRKG